MGNLGFARKRAALGFAIAAMALAVACTEATPTPAAPAATPTTAAVPTNTAVPAPSPTRTATPATPPAPAATATPLPAGLFLDVTDPKDNSVVRTAQIAVAGRTSPDAVLSVNGKVVDVKGDGAFTTQVTLVEGPNSVEVIASNLSGQQQSKQLAVIYAK